MRKIIAALFYPRSVNNRRAREKQIPINNSILGNVVKQKGNVMKRRMSAGKIAVLIMAGMLVGVVGNA